MTYSAFLLVVVLVMSSASPGIAMSPSYVRRAGTQQEDNAVITTAKARVRLSWKRIPAKDPLNPASARRQLPESIAWAAAPIMWDILPTSYGTDGSVIGPFTLSSMHDTDASPITAALKHISPRLVTLSLRNKRADVPFYTSTFVPEQMGSLAQIAAFNDGASVVGYMRVVCGECVAVSGFAACVALSSCDV